MSILLFLACVLPDPVSMRSERAALVCYDNGTLVYASETTVEELSAALSEWRSCRDAESSRAAEYRKALEENCPWAPSGGQYPGETRIQYSFRLKESRDAQEQCMKSKGYQIPTESAGCNSLSPAPHLGPGRAWRFNDKGVEFDGVNLKCVARIPGETTTIKETE